MSYDPAWSRRVENYSSTEDMLAYLPRPSPAGRIPVIWCHGFFANSATPAFKDSTNTADDIRAVAALGYPVLVPDLGGASTWGTDAAWGLVATTLTYAGTAFGCRTDKVALVGESMGALTALNYAWRNQATVAAVMLRVPCVALSDFRNRNQATFGTAVEDAYGGLAAFEAALPTHDPSHPAQLAALRSLASRGKAWHTSADELIPPAEVVAWCAATGWARAEVAGNHAAGANTPVPDTTRFLVDLLDAA